ncbi:MULTISPECIES: PstS family phosphate ABC transporter substrate-binding protein [Pseudoalteromonas]|uniref:Phosphate-binding protein n=2 Tax=Pseudoalteromonas ruthenica TaxID=151081 RepID=A0A0F4PQW4_9GAMM|nr:MULTISPECIES: phosphate ABC transporter substrate-binding protein PstS family protein [Pseudoalteromonas]KJY97885.1 phosphate-binding protein [Pseudoalteromonas ruthenica]KJZ01912.1 phosphate-binding protein [Pseudoalteromonas ruthenica]MCF2862807.1 phosphate ABC transporter substrate-binding protein PstS family protein [Pseudoalteromonas sp. CNAT2-18]MCG7543395.1 phosphate ABC transporter substrate-binding protein PstS family protein [Pseudoalteromonas sp. MM17-2]MCG7558741.1 phosphate ABC|tara:strand:- start:1777 stop:2745 length:969 start_codon:yes stop_codon:yes gene_type:complete
MKFKNLVAAMGVAVSALTAGQAVALDKAIPEYEKTSGISGNFSSVGSDTLANMMTFWAEEYKRIYPNVNIQIQAAGSSTAPPALTEGTANFGPMSRKMKSKEIEAFEKRHGYKPTEIRVAIDALAVFVHKDNPIEGLRIDQVDAIFSSTRKCGASEQINRWGDVGLTGDWAAKDIQLYGRNSVSGTYGYFKKKALCKGDFRNNVNEQPGSASVVQSISSSVNAIGYSGIGYKTSGVRTVPLAKKGDKFVDATLDNVATGKYPLSRFLYVYVNKHPNKPLSPIDAEFVKMVLSQTGQKIVEKDGYVPLSSKMVERELKRLGLQ